MALGVRLNSHAVAEQGRRVRWGLTPPIGTDNGPIISYAEIERVPRPDSPLDERLLTDPDDSDQDGFHRRR